MGVQMMAYRDGKRQRITTTEHNGWFALDGLDGEYQIVVLRGAQTAPAYPHLAELPGTFHTGGEATHFDFRGIHGRLLDADDQPVATEGEDNCGKTLTSCKLRFDGLNLVENEHDRVPFGGIPGARKPIRG